MPKKLQGYYPIMATAYTQDGQVDLASMRRLTNFLIENGAITKPVRNLRATPAVLEAFSKAEQISKDPVLYPQYSAVLCVPALKIAAMPFVEDSD